MQAALYARVSTHDQQTLAMQIESMREYATRRGWMITEALEEIASGAKDNRPKRQELLKAARQRKLDVILVWKLDRWGRSLVDLMTTLHELTALGVGFVSLTEALDLTTPAGRAFAGFLAVFAEFERDVIRERIQSGITDARKRGKAHGSHAPQPTMRHRFGRWRSEVSVKRQLHGTWACGGHPCGGCWGSRRGRDRRQCSKTLHGWSQSPHRVRPST